MRQLHGCLLRRFGVVEHLVTSGLGLLKAFLRVTEFLAFLFLDVGGLLECLPDLGYGASGRCLLHRLEDSLVFDDCRKSLGSEHRQRDQHQPPAVLLEGHRAGRKRIVHAFGQVGAAAVAGHLDRLCGGDVDPGQAGAERPGRGDQHAVVDRGIRARVSVSIVSEPRAQRDEERLSADCLIVDIPADVIYLTNGYSTADPMFITRAIGAHVARAIEPYHFFNSPKGRANGIIPLHGEQKADIEFDVEGGPFHWWKLNLAKVKGKVHWKGNQISLRDMEADFYGGYASGIANIDLSKPRTTIYNFAAACTNAHVQPLVKDLFDSTNRLEGFLNAELVVTHANSAVTNDIQGYGKASLRDQNRFGYLTDKTVDAQWQTAFVNYLIKKGITDTIYWSINPESGDTGGLYTTPYRAGTNESGWGMWGALDTRKINLLRPLWGN